MVLAEIRMENALNDLIITNHYRPVDCEEAEPVSHGTIDPGMGAC